MYAPEKEAMVWKIKNFPGGKEFLLRCKFGLPSVEAEEEAKGRMPPIRVKFEIPYFTVSGIQVSPSPEHAHVRTCLHHASFCLGRLVISYAWCLLSCLVCAAVSAGVLKQRVVVHGAFIGTVS